MRIWYLILFEFKSSTVLCLNIDDLSRCTILNLSHCSHWFCLLHLPSFLHLPLCWAWWDWSIAQSCCLHTLLLITWTSLWVYLGWSWYRPHWVLWNLYLPTFTFCFLRPLWFAFPLSLLLLYMGWLPTTWWLLFDLLYLNIMCIFLHLALQNILLLMVCFKLRWQFNLWWLDIRFIMVVNLTQINTKLILGVVLYFWVFEGYCGFKFRVMHIRFGWLIICWMLVKLGHDILFICFWVELWRLSIWICFLWFTIFIVN